MYMYSHSHHIKQKEIKENFVTYLVYIYIIGLDASKSSTKFFKEISPNSKQQEQFKTRKFKTITHVQGYFHSFLVVINVNSAAMKYVLWLHCLLIPHGQCCWQRSRSGWWGLTLTLTLRWTTNASRVCDIIQDTDRVRNISHYLINLTVCQQVKIWFIFTSSSIILPTLTV